MQDENIISDDGSAGLKKNTLKLPHPSADAPEIFINEIHSAHVVPGGDGIWFIIIVLNNRSSISVPFSKENVACLAQLGILVSYPSGHADSSRPKPKI